MRRAILLAGALLSSGMIAAGVIFALWVVATANSAPNISGPHGLQPRVPGQTSEVFAGDGERLGYMASSVLRTQIGQAQQPKLLREATVAIEDRRFYQHGGVDYMGLLRAAIKDVLQGGGIQGGSTLTMQLITNVYLPDSIKDAHNIRYKIIQAKLATELENRRSKDWILTQYLNDVPYGTTYGQTAIGVAAASQMFFNRPVRRLDLAQIALLAGLPQAPTTYNPFLDPKLARWRRGLVLQAMVRSGYISQGTADATQAQGLQVQPNQTYQTVRQPYVFDYVKQQLIQDVGLRTVDAGGLKVYTTINLADQQAAAQAIQANEGHPGDPAAALVSIDPATGDIVAMQNSTTYGTGKGQTTFDYATQAQRQTGSAFKPFVLMTLIKDDDGDPNATYYVSKFLAPGWLPGYPSYSVHTAEMSYQGSINITKATALSDNTVFAQLGVDVGMTNVDQTAHEMGITTKLFGYPSEAIGGLHIGVSPLQMADAYATLANGGDHVAPTIIARVTQGGKTIYTAPSSKTQVFTQGQAYAGTQTLETVLQYGTGTGANYGCPAAGKTGTTSNYTDAWFVGYTPKLSTAVWVGYPASEVSMTNVNGLGPGYGGTLAAPIWKQFMQSASNGYCGDFPQPAQYWHGVEYFGPHAVQAYVPPPAVTTTTSTGTTTTGATNTTGGNGLTTPTYTQSGNQPGNAGNTANPNGSGGVQLPPAAGGGGH
ncbi:MAG: transglycosylase domain-containing protein [Acidobacteriota bacterium]|nr:transglycosylase domain-containing protein [Acidobacteriota bacterium]